MRCVQWVRLNSHSGFTLIELVIVIVILSVLATGSVQFISFAAQGYVDTARRSGLASSASVVNEKIGRLLRQSLPGSVRVTANQACIEFIPVLSASYYVQAPIVGESVVETEVHVVPVSSALANVGYLAIFPVVADINQLYDNTLNPGVISTQQASITGGFNGADVFEFSGGSSFRFLQGSPQRRLFVTAQPQTFCQEGQSIFFYRNYGFVGDVSNLVASLPTSVPNRLLIADGIQTNSLTFFYTPSSLRRNALVSYELIFEESGSQETLSINQEVQVRNVP